MDQAQVIQEKQYDFPYHHIPNIYKGHFSQVRVLPWGHVYMAYLDAVLMYIEKTPFISMLDIGCGDGKFLYEARRRFPNAMLAGNDYSEHAIALARAFNFNNDVYLSTQPAEEVVKEKGLFDVVVAIEVLEHIPLTETGDFCKSFASALAPQGVGIITVPSDNRAVNKKHYQHFNKESLTRTLEPHLKVVEVFFLNDISRKSWYIQRLLNNRFFILTYSKAVHALYRYYCKNLLATTPDRCERLMAVVKRP